MVWSYGQEAVDAGLAQATRHKERGSFDSKHYIITTGFHTQGLPLYGSTARFISFGQH